MHPGCFIFVSLVEDGVSDAQHMLSTLAQEEHVRAEYTFPVIADILNPHIEVTQDFYLVTRGCCFDEMTQFLIKLLPK